MSKTSDLPLTTLALMGVAFIATVTTVAVVLVIALSSHSRPAELRLYVYPPQDATKVEQLVISERDGKPFPCDELFEIAGEPFTLEEFETSNFGQLVACVEEGR